MKRSFTRPPQHKAFWMTVGTLAIADEQVPATEIAKIDVLIKPYSIALPFELKTKDPLDFNDSFAPLKKLDARSSHLCITHLETAAEQRWASLQTWDGQTADPAGCPLFSAPGRAQGRTRIPAQAGRRHSRHTPAPLRLLGSAYKALEPHPSRPIAPHPPCGPVPHMHIPSKPYPACTLTPVYFRPLPATPAAA